MLPEVAYLLYSQKAPLLLPLLPCTHHVGWPLEIDPRYAAVRGAVPLCLEWWHAHQELVREDAQGPDVRGVIVLPPLSEVQRKKQKQQKQQQTRARRRRRPKQSGQGARALDSRAMV